MSISQLEAVVLPKKCFSCLPHSGHQIILSLPSEASCATGYGSGQIICHQNLAERGASCFIIHMCKMSSSVCGVRAAGAICHRRRLPKRPLRSLAFWLAFSMRSLKAEGMSWPSKLRTTALTSGTLVRKTCSSRGMRSNSAVSPLSSFHGLSCTQNVPSVKRDADPARHIMNSCST